LFGKNITYIALRHGHYLRNFAYRFIELCSPALDEAVIRAGVAPAQAEAVND
jgi:LysR family cys regulon transcriptional activator